MITVETGKYRFFTGDNITYKDAEPSWLLEQAGIADEHAMRCYAAAGLMRALLDTPTDTRGEAFLESVDCAKDVIINVQHDKATAPIPPTVRTLVNSLSPVNGVLDATSVKATSANKPSLSAKLLDRYIPPHDAKLIIGLGHGGILSSLLTFAELSGDDNVYYPIRFSKYKSKDKQPMLGDGEVEHLKEISGGRAVVIHDEDRGLDIGGTINEAVRCIDQALDVRAYGYTPVLGRHPSNFWPQIVRYSAHGQLWRDEYAWWSDEMKDLIRESEQESA